MTSRHLSVLLIICSFLTGIGSLRAETPDRIARAGLIRLSDISAFDGAVMPQTGGPVRWRVASGYERRFDLPDLDELNLGVACSGRAWGAGLSIRSHTANPYFRQQVVQAGLSLRLPGMITALAGGNAFIVTAPGTDVTWSGTTSWSANVGLRVDQGKLHAAAVAERLGNPKLGTQFTFDPIGRGYLEFDFTSELLLLGGVTVQRNQPPRYAIAQLFPMGTRVVASIGFRTAPREYTGGLDVSFGSLHLLYGASVHPVLGLTHSAGLELRLGRRPTPSGVFE